MSKRLSKSDNEIREIICKKILEASTKFRKAPYEIKATEFWAVNNNTVTDWQVRKLGGFTNIRTLEFPVPDDVKLNDAPKKFTGIESKLTHFTTHVIEPESLFKLSKLGDNDVFRMLVMPDAHTPEHDPAAVEAFIQFGEWYKPHGIINIGDFMEMEAVSHWPARDLRPRRLAPQIQEGKKILQTIDERFGPQLVFKYFLIGNHEDWLDQYIVAKVPELFDGIQELGVNFGVAHLLGLADRGYSIIPLNEILSIGDHCHFIHGYYTNRYHANKHLDVFGVNIYYGHLHDVQSTTQVSVKGVHEAMSLGCLRDLNAPFLKGRPNNWTHAFGIFEFRKDGQFTRYVPIIINGKFSFAGKLFDGNAK